MIRYIFILFLLMGYRQAQAQSGTVPARIYLSSGDSLDGYVIRNSEKEMTVALFFSKDEKAPASAFTAYKPGQIKGYWLKQELQRYHTVQYETEKNGQPENELRFARLLVEANVKLYQLKKEEDEQQSYGEFDQTDVFIAEKDGRFFTLSRSARQDGYSWVKINTYREKLLSDFADCPGLSKEKIAGLDFSVKDMTAFFRQYNICRFPESRSVVIRSGSKFRTETSLYAGFSVNLSSIEKGGSGPSGGIFFEIRDSRAVKRSSLLTGIGYRRSPDYSAYVFARLDTFSYSGYQINVPLMFKWRLPAGTTMEPFIGGGVVTSVMQKTQESRRAGKVNSTEFTGYIGLMAGLEFQKKWSFLLSYETTNVFFSGGLVYLDCRLAYRF